MAKRRKKREDDDISEFFPGDHLTGDAALSAALEASYHLGRGRRLTKDGRWVSGRKKRRKRS